MTDRAKFEREALVHLDAAYNLAMIILRAPADAEDAAQDALVRAFRAFDQVRGPVKPWLLTIVRNACYRRLQDRRRAGNVISLDEAFGGRPMSEEASEAPSPEQSLLNASDRSLLEAALEALPPVYREAIVLREIEELSYQEIADVIGAPMGTVMSRLARARAELRTTLTKLMNRDESNAM
jgi:RNA polymerase sigma-70 factor (ECF subfamily)